MISYSTQDVRQFLSARSRASTTALAALAELEPRLQGVPGSRGNTSMLRRHAESSATKAGLKLSEITSHQLAGVFSTRSLV